MIAAFKTANQDAGAELRRILETIQWADQFGLLSPIADRDRAATAKAFVYVGLSAALERLAKDTIAATNRELTNHALPHHTLKPPLLSLVCHSTFCSLRDIKPSRSWANRIQLIDKVLDASPAEFAESATPLDGKTIRGHHFELIWKVFSLAGNPTLSPLHRTALEELANGRNNVAHGHVRPVDFGKTKATRDLLNLHGKVSELCDHLVNSLTDLFSSRRFNR
jgi:hypothetical protein